MSCEVYCTFLENIDILPIIRKIAQNRIQLTKANKQSLLQEPAYVNINIQTLFR